MDSSETDVIRDILKEIIWNVEKLEGSNEVDFASRSCELLSHHQSFEDTKEESSDDLFLNSKSESDVFHDSSIEEAAQCLIQLSRNNSEIPVVSATKIYQQYAEDSGCIENANSGSSKQNVVSGWDQNKDQPEKMEVEGEHCKTNEENIGKIDFNITLESGSEKLTIKESHDEKTSIGEAEGGNILRSVMSTKEEINQHSYPKDRNDGECDGANRKTNVQPLSSPPSGNKMSVHEDQKIIENNDGASFENDANSISTISVKSDFDECLPSPSSDILVIQEDDIEDITEREKEASKFEIENSINIKTTDIAGCSLALEENEPKFTSKNVEIDAPPFENTDKKTAAKIYEKCNVPEKDQETSNSSNMSSLLKEEMMKLLPGMMKEIAVNMGLQINASEPRVEPKSTSTNKVSIASNSNQMSGEKVVAPSIPETTILSKLKSVVEASTSPDQALSRSNRSLEQQQQSIFTLAEKRNPRNFGQTVEQESMTTNENMNNGVLSVKTLDASGHETANFAPSSTHSRPSRRKNLIPSKRVVSAASNLRPKQDTAKDPPFHHFPPAYSMVPPHQVPIFESPSMGQQNILPIGAQYYVPVAVDPKQKELQMYMKAEQVVNKIMVGSDVYKQKKLIEENSSVKPRPDFHKNSHCSVAGVDSICDASTGPDGLSYKIKWNVHTWENATNIIGTGLEKFIAKFYIDSQKKSEETYRNNISTQNQTSKRTVGTQTDTRVLLSESELKLIAEAYLKINNFGIRIQPEKSREGSGSQKPQTFKTLSSQEKSSSSNLLKIPTTLTSPQNKSSFKSPDLCSSLKLPSSKSVLKSPPSVSPKSPQHQSQINISPNESIVKMHQQFLLPKSSQQGLSVVTLNHDGKAASPNLSVSRVVSPVSGSKKAQPPVKVKETVVQKCQPIEIIDDTDVCFIIQKHPQIQSPLKFPLTNQLSPQIPSSKAQKNESVFRLPLFRNQIKSNETGLKPSYPAVSGTHRSETQRLATVEKAPIKEVQSTPDIGIKGKISVESFAKRKSECYSNQSRPKKRRDENSEEERKKSKYDEYIDSLVFDPAIRITPILMAPKKTEQKNKEGIKEFDFATTLANAKVSSKVAQQHGKEEKCTFCQQTLYGSRNIKLHHAKFARYKCPRCNIRICNRKELYKHITGHLRYNYQCHKCLKQFQLLSSFKDHKKSVHHPQMFANKVSSNVPSKKCEWECTDCGKRFKTFLAVRKHFVKFCNNLPKDSKVKCNECKRLFRSEDTLMRHTQLHKLLEQEKANVTTKRIPRKRKFSFRRVRRNRFSIKQKLTFKNKYCMLCVRGFKGIDSFYAHVNNTSCAYFKADGMCMLCKKMFHSLESLKSHVSTCFKETLTSLVKPMGKRESCSSGSDTEVTKNTRAVYHCSRCRTMFPSKFIFKKHNILFHAKVKTLQCNRCFFKCTSQNRLKLHLKRKQCPKMTDYKCYLCDHQNRKEQSFKSLSLFVKHVRSHRKIAQQKKETLEIIPQEIVSLEGKIGLVTLSKKDVELLIGKSCVYDISGFGKHRIAVNPVVNGYQIVASAKKKSPAPVNKNKKEVKRKCFDCLMELPVGRFHHHFRTHHNLRMVQLMSCEQCNMMFTDISSYFSHIRNIHPEQLINQNTKFLSTATNRAETNKTEPQNNFPNVAAESTIDSFLSFVGKTDHYYVCDQCQIVCETKLSMRVHLNTKHLLSNEVIEKNDSILPKTSEWKCCICSKYVKSVFLHARKHSEMFFECYRCNVKVSSKNAMIKHFAQTHPTVFWGDEDNAWVLQMKDQCIQRVVQHLYKYKDSKDLMPKVPSIDMNHQCSSCHLVFTREETYARHRRAKVCSEEQPYQFFQCPICNCLLTELKRIDLHIEVCHGFSPRLLELEPDIVVIKESQTHKCADCDLKFADINTMKKCALFHHNVNTEMCEICLDTFPNLESLKYHIYSNHRLHFCIICRKGLHTYFSFVHHCQLHVLESLVRRDANGKMVIELESNPQKRKRSKLFPYETIDQEAFVVSAKIPENVLDDSRLFYCHVCGKNIEGELTFIVHVKTHVLSRRLQCFICPESFVEEEDLKLHYQHVKHNQGASRTYRPEGFVCFHCSLVFENLDALITHLDANRVGAKYPELQKSNEVMKTVQRYIRLQAKPPAVSDSLPVEWDCAEKSAGITSILNSKYAISRSARKSSKDFKYLPNTNVQSLTCPVCGFRTTTLETHLKWHFDVYLRNFTCCSGVFFSSKSLLQHVKEKHCLENTGQKCCCPYCFIMTDLKHIVNHWDGLVFSSSKVRCPVCNLVFQKKCLAHHLMVDEKLNSGVISVEVPNKHGGETASLSKVPAPKKLKAIAPKNHEFSTARKASTPKKVQGKSDANNNIVKTATKNTRNGMPKINRGKSLEIQPGNSKAVQVDKNQRKKEKTAVKNLKRRKKTADQYGIRRKTNNTINESSKESSKTPPVKPTSATEKQMQNETHADETTDQSLENITLSNADHFEKQTRKKTQKEESDSPMTKQKMIKNVPPHSDDTQTKTVQPESLDTKSSLNEVALVKSPTSLIYEEMLHKSDFVFACEFCSWDFCCYDQLKDHLMRHILTLKEEVNEVLKLTCHLCARIFSKNTITKHMALCHMKDTNAHRRNRKCEDDTSKQVALVNAVNALLDNNYFCTLCAKTEESLHSYLDHYKEIHPLIYTQEMHKFIVSTNPVIVKNTKQYNKNQSKTTSMKCKTPEILPQKKGKSTKKATSSTSKAQATKKDKAAKKISPPPRKKTKSNVTDNGSGIADKSIDQPTTQQGGEKFNSPPVGKYDLPKCLISSPSMPYPYNCQVCGRGYYKRNVYLKHFKTAHPWMCSDTTDGDNKEKHTGEPQEITMKESGNAKDLNQEEGAVESLPVVSGHSSPSEINGVESLIKATEPVTPSKKSAVVLPTSTDDLPEVNVQSKIENMLASKKKSPPSTSNTRKIIRPGKPPSAFKKNPRRTNDLKQDDRQQIDEESNSAIDDPSDDNEPPGSIHMEIVNFEPNDESNKNSENQVKKEPSTDAKTKSDDKAKLGKKAEPTLELKETDTGMVKTVAKESNKDDGNESEGTISNDEDEENEVEEETEEEIIESSSEDEVDSKTTTISTKLKEVAPKETIKKLEKATPKVEATSTVEAIPTDAKITSPSAMGGYFVTNYPLVCLFCGIGFYRRHMLKSHLTKKHPNCYTPDLEKSNSFVNLNYVDVSTPSNLQTAEVLPKRSRSKFNEVMKALKPATKSTAKKADSLVVTIKNTSNKISPSPSRKRPSVEKLVIKAKKKKKIPSDEIETSPEESNEEAESSDEDTDSEVESKDVAYRHKCKWCDQLFVEKRNLGKHVTRHFRGAKLNKLTCVSCFCLVERHLLKRHMHMSHSDVKLSLKRNWCTRCSYSSKKNLDKHIMQAHPTLLKIECRICDARFSTTLSYNKHFQMTHGKSLDEESLMCLFCNKKFGSLDKLYCHFSIVHMKKNKSLFCALCCKYFYGRTDLENHKQEFHQNDKYQCGLCLVDFESVEACEKHVQVHKNKTDHRCPLCKFYFESIDRLTNHKKTHDQMLKCNGCEKCFKSNVEFLSHREGGKCEFTFNACCLHCDLTFDSEKTMIEHTGMHSKNPAATMEQVCSQCDQSFDTVTKLMEHIEKTHNQLPVSMKPTTGYETDGESMSRVTNDNTCDICGETFIRYEIYQEHLKKHQ